MAQLVSIKKERFCQLIVNGAERADAYLEAGHECSRKSAMEAACRLLKEPRIVERMNELRGKAAIRAEITTHSLLAQLEQAFQAAMSQRPPQVSAAVSALREKAILAGLRVEKSESGGPGDFDSLSDDELQQLLLSTLDEYNTIKAIRNNDANIAPAITFNNDKEAQ